MLYAVAVKLFVGVTKHPIPILCIPSTIGTKINLVLLLVLGRLCCQCTALWSGLLVNPRQMKENCLKCDSNSVFYYYY